MLAICAAASMAGEFYFSLLLAIIFPGPLFTITLLLGSKEQSGWRVLVFLLSGTALYYLAVYIVLTGKDNDVFFAGRFLASGVAGFVLLYLLYDHLLTNRRWATPLLRAAWLGLVATLPATVCLVAIGFIDPAYPWYDTPLRIGVLSIFPIWQYLFSREVVRTDPAFSNPDASLSVIR